MPFHPIQPEKLSAAVVRQIELLILRGILRPGERLPAERDLAERLGMSQTPIIQALKWLEFQQLVRHEPNRGYFTAPIDPKEVQEIYEVRETLELSLLPGIVRAIDRSGVRTLRAALEEFNGARGASEHMLALGRDAALALNWQDLVSRPPSREQYLAFVRLAKSMKPAFAGTMWPSAALFPHVRYEWPADALF